MPTLSDRQALIRGILLATEEETRLYFTSLEHDEDLLEELDTIEAETSDSSSSSSSTSSSSSSSTSSSSSSSDSDELMPSLMDQDNGDSEDERHTQNMTDYSEILELLLASRVLNSSGPVPKCSQLYLVLV